MLQLDHVKKQYDNFALDVTLEVPSGRVIGLVGPNGSGKSTTFKAILDLISIDSGTIRMFGTEGITPAKKEEIGVVFADSGFSGYICIPDLIPMLRQLYSGFDEADFLKRCKEYQLPMKKKIRTFSTGMKKRLHIAAALSHNARLLLLDEPTSGMDVIAREELIDRLRGYMETEDRSILISSHISGDLEGICDEVYFLDQGRIILHEETDVLLDQYGVLKVTEEQYAKIEKQYLLRQKKEPYGYCCLTKEKQFYQENYPEIAIEKAGIDSVIHLMIKGEEL